MNEEKRCLPDFRVKYRFYASEEGGRRHPIFQGLYRPDWMYDEDFPELFKQKLGQKNVWMINPVFVDEDGLEYSYREEVPMQGFADMYILFPKLRDLHRKVLRIGTKGYIVEGTKKVAEAEVVDILYLNHSIPE